MLNKLNIKIRTIPSRSSSSITINFVGETTNTSFFDFDFLSNFKSVSLSYPCTSQCCHRFFCRPVMLPSSRGRDFWF